MKRSAGFTLIELMLVVIIIGVIAAIAVPRLSGNTEKAKIAATKQTIASASLALDNYELDVGRFPSSDEGLRALIERPAVLSEKDGWDGPYMREMPRDSWNRELVYKYPGDESVDYDIVSAGRDGQAGNEDDITNYRKDDKQ
jgi:general secretion pathway protein G